MKRHTMWFSGILASLMICLLIIGSAAAQGDSDPAPTPFWEDNDDPALDAQMDHVEAATAILRDLDPITPVTRAFLSREELLDYLILLLDEDYPPDLARDDVIFYSAFNFMPADTDLRQLQLELLAEQIGGFYEPALDAMFVISASAEMTLTTRVLYAHEFTHALQDQYFDLESVDMDALQFTAPDQLLAYQGLVEGDAMLMTEGYQTWLLQQNPGAAFSMLSEALSVPTEALNAVPAITRVELLFPYTEGRNFAYAMFVQGGGWPLVNSLYENPPTSTEQIIHPEIYTAGEQPVAVEVPDVSAVLGDGWREVWHRTLGEFYLREHLRQQLPDAAAVGAAAGWGGDRYRLYHNEASGDTALVWRTVWDTVEDAAAFADAYEQYAAQRDPAAGVTTIITEASSPEEVLIIHTPTDRLTDTILQTLVKD